MRWHSLVVFLAVLALTLVACSGGGDEKPQVTPTATVAAYFDGPADATRYAISDATQVAYSATKAVTTPTATPTPLLADASVRACTSEDIVAQGDFPTAPATMTVGMGISIANRSNTPCQLTGPPDFNFFDANGVPVAQLGPDRDSAPCGPDRPPHFCLRREPVLLLPGLDMSSSRTGKAWLQLVWSTGTSCAMEHRHGIFGVALILPVSRGEVHVDVAAFQDGGRSAPGCSPSLWSFDSVSRGD